MFLIQASMFALALWFLAGTLYVNLRIERELRDSIHIVEAELRIHTQISSTLLSLRQAAGRQADSSGASPAENPEDRLATLAGLVQQYGALGTDGRNLRWLSAIESAREDLTHATREVFARVGSETSTEIAGRFRRFETLSRRMELLVDSRTNEQFGNLAESHRRLEDYTRALTLLFVALGLLSFLILLQTRRVMERQIWEPLEQLRRMAVAVRSGNLSISGVVPHNLEFGALMQSFLDMSGGLREMRGSLEQKVRERTASLEAAQRELVQAAKLSSLGLLISGVAHEINNPLTSILGFSELALARPPVATEPRLRRALEAIRDEALRMKGLVANLSAFSRRGPRRTSRVDLRRVLDRILELRGYQLRAVSIELHCAIPRQAVWVDGDADELLQVLINLVRNSEQAITGFRERGDIWLAGWNANGDAWLSVRDNGAGMSREVQESIFDPFFTTKPVGQGTGLGMSITHGIVQRHRGTILVESTVGAGTTVRVMFPAASEAAHAEAKPEGISAEVEKGRQKDAATGAEARERRALVLDDEPLVAEYVKEGLESSGWSCVVRANADGLEAALENAEYDLVVCDLKMPGRNGLDVLRMLRERWPRLARRFLLMTGNLADAEPVSTDELAKVRILRKPFTLEQLTEAVRGVMSKCN
jgi:signal transduction histidine kinase/ActR/RegA family two-component response regulator